MFSFSLFYDLWLLSLKTTGYFSQFMNIMANKLLYVFFRSYFVCAFACFGLCFAYLGIFLSV